MTRFAERASALATDDDRPAEQFTLPPQVQISEALGQNPDLLRIGLVGVLRQPLLGSKPVERFVAVPIIR